MTILRRIGWWLSRRRKEAELQDELQFHLDEETEDRQEAGASASAARRAALLGFGNSTLVTEDTRAVWGWRIVEQFGQDVRYAFRTMRRSPAFTLLAVTSLALGIGANAAIFSFIDALLLRELPVHDASALVRMTWRTPRSEMHGSSYHRSSFTDPDPSVGHTGGVFSYPAFNLFRSRPGLFSAVFAYQSTGSIGIGLRGATEAGEGEYVSGDYFRGLGIVPAAGRLLDQSDDAFGAAPVAVLSFGTARTRFASPADAIGQPVLIDSRPFTVVGVAPREFFGTDPGKDPAVYLPLHANVLIDDRPGSEARMRYANGSRFWLEIMARLQPGVSMERAQAELAVPFQQISDELKASGTWGQAPALALKPGADGIDGMRRMYGEPLRLLIALAAAILLLACANIANLLLARAGARAREIGVRLGLGAGRARIVRQLITESVVLSVVGGALGVGLALWSVPAITPMLGPGQEGFASRVHLSWPSLGLAAALAIITGAIFGLAPALRATRPNVVSALKRHGGRLPRRLLLTAQVALTFVILVAAGVFVRTVANYQAIDPGFSPDNVLTVRLSGRQAGLGSDQAAAFYRALRDRLRATPGVEDVGLTESALLGDGMSHTTVQPVGGRMRNSSQVLSMGGGFFSTLKLPIVRGRAIDERDESPGAPPVVVVDESYARLNFGSENPIGRRVHMELGADLRRTELEIVGIAATVAIGELQARRSPTVYLPFSMAPWGSVDRLVVVIRAVRDPERLAGVVRQIVHDLNPNIPIVRIATQRELIAMTMSRQILLARLCSIFAVIALVIAVAGLYGSVLYDVTRRRVEIGIRMALGAPRGQVVRLVLGEVVAVVAIGLLIGGPLSAWGWKFAQALLFNVERGDPATFAGAVAMLTAAALIAGYMPARAALRMSPTVALRQD